MSEETDRLLSEFKTITGLDDENDDKIKRLLTINDNNLNNAVSGYFEHGFTSVESSGVEVHEEASEVRQRNVSRNGSRHDSVVNLQNQLFLDNFLPKLPMAPRISNHWQLEIGLHSSLKEQEQEQKRKNISTLQQQLPFPVHSIWLILMIIPKSLFQMLVSIFRYLVGTSPEKSKNKFPKAFNYDEYDPRYKLLEDSVSDDETLVALLSSANNNYNLRESNFNEIHTSTQKSYTWLLIILVNDETTDFISNILDDPNFNMRFNKESGLFKENNIYVSNVERSPEAFEVGKAYQVKTLPFISLIGNVSNNPSVMSSMSMVYKSNLSPQFLTAEKKNSTIKKIVRNLNKLLESFNPQLITQRIDLQEIEFARLVKQQQDDAYVQSLEKDRLKKLEKERNLKFQQELISAKKQREDYLASLALSNWLEELRKEPSTRISFKMPDGRRIIETISKAAQINDLYLYIELQLLESAGDEPDIQDTVSASADNLQTVLSRAEFLSKFPFRFELIQPYPKKVITPTEISINDATELKSGANLLVEYLTEDEEDEDDEVDV
ncbi:uncharacterized protein PRCAT00002265001 [Priceomyces carsonii]|uniref:uncharacterized protein n=1 Tax=Priceomyces carsonii TaxID=28549 RepID=UPI002EDA99A2|nr:unnamed protein product [Priceomyces carsonii]